MKDTYDRGLIKRNTEGLQHQYYADLETLGERPPTLPDYEVEGEDCLECGRPARVHYRGAPLCQRCFKEEKRMIQKIEDLEEK